MNANAFSQKDYENKTAFGPQKNKPKTNPIKANFKGLFIQLHASNHSQKCSISIFFRPENT